MNTPASTGRSRGFTLIELAAVIAMVAVLATLAVPALAKSRIKGSVMTCLNHQRQLVLAWHLYARDYGNRVVNNFGVVETLTAISSGRLDNWANNVMTWSPGDGTYWRSVTNVAWVRDGILGRYTGDTAALYQCPADQFASTAMVARGIRQRNRSVSMNLFFGLFSTSRSDPTALGRNWAFPEFRQFLKMADCPSPGRTWLFLDEHPDSINDGYYLNQPTTSSWQDLPAAYHEGGAGFSFADGHTELKTWSSPTSRYPVRYSYGPTKVFDAAGKVDFQWWRERTGFIKRDGTRMYGY